jgi:hypothetical protein
MPRSSSSIMGGALSNPLQLLLLLLVLEAALVVRAFVPPHAAALRPAVARVRNHAARSSIEPSNQPTHPTQP